MTAITLVGATMLVLMALKLVGYLLTVDRRSRIRWPLHVYVEERRRGLQSLTQVAGVGRASRSPEPARRAVS